MSIDNREIADMLRETQRLQAENEELRSLKIESLVAVNTVQSCYNGQVRILKITKGEMYEHR